MSDYSYGLMLNAMFNIQKSSTSIEAFYASLSPSFTISLFLCFCRALLHSSLSLFQIRPRHLFRISFPFLRSLKWRKVLRMGWELFLLQSANLSYLCLFPQPQCGSCHSHTQRKLQHCTPYTHIIRYAQAQTYTQPSPAGQSAWQK